MQRNLLIPLLLGAMLAPAPAAAQESAAPDSAQVAAPVAGFYEPPDFEAYWRQARQKLQSLSADDLTRARFVAILDSLAAGMQSDIDRLLHRVEAIEGFTRKGYTAKFYRSPLTRQRILGDEITAEAATELPHFHAVYDPQGHLLQVRYVEPRRWRMRQLALSRRSYQAEAGSVPLVRYFKQWDIRKLSGRGYVRKKRLLEGRPYFRVLYDENDIIEEVQRYNIQGQLIFSIDYRRDSDASNRFAEVHFAGDGSGSLLDVHPYLFERDYSLVKPGWRTAVTSNEQDQITSVQVFNQHGEVSYYYTYGSSYDEETRKLTIRGTALSPAEEIRKVFSIVYDKKGRMEKKVYYTPEGKLIKSITYRYTRRSDDIVAVTRNAAGLVTGQRSFLDPALTD